ncbi:aromatic ring-hydroxylating dioxygenase subunit alpha [Phenylobacterium sp.]|uniref:aromatic ring-hydroxylating oxygenase subunit alpha n=1 Tax=Phenylobacterium sp. TaxID=1871053 RepID=UPI0025F801A6|nr:aromatic ring-hydroxylating dioxygenase subunit alpha [Phenylobacterium sp.]
MSAMAEGGARAEARFGHGFLTDIWYLAGLSADLRPGRPRRVDVLGEPIMLGRAPDGSLFALRDVCPHRAAPLSAGRFRTDASGVATIECPYHGWRFGADGACAAIPSLTADQAMDVGRIQVRRYPAAESQGLVFVWMGATPASAPDHPPPVFPGVVGGRPKLVDRMVFDAHIDQAVVGLMDPAHGPYVHRQWWWRTAGSEHDKQKRFEPAEAGFAMVRHTPSRNSRAYALLGGRPQTEITFRLPGLRWEHVTVGARQLLSLTCLTPIDEGRTQVTQIVWSDHPVFALLGPLVAAWARTFLRQDARMVELQNQGLRHDPALMWIDDADRQAKWYQALKREWAASRREGRPFVNPVEPATLRWRS